MAKIVIDKLPESSRRFPRFKLVQQRPSGRTVVEVKGVSKAYDNPVLNDVSLTVDRGDRLAIIGPNGIGKSTLLKIMMGETEADTGTIEWGYETHPGYFSQDHQVDTQSSGTVLSWLWDCASDKHVGFIRGKLAEVLFGRDDVDKKVRNLSGGETTRLVMAKLGILQPNVLVLDEPTNHLDFEGIEALAAGLKSYDGSLVFVSHNRWFVDELATRIVEIRPDGIEDYRGSYREYLAHCGDDHLDAEAVIRKARKQRKKDTS